MQRTQISLTAEARHLLDAEAAASGRSLSALIRDAVMATYGPAKDAPSALGAIDAAFGSWAGVEYDGEEYVEGLRSGRRIDEVLGR